MGSIRQAEDMVCGRGCVTDLRGSKVSHVDVLDGRNRYKRAVRGAFVTCPAIRGRTLLVVSGIPKNP